MVDLADYIVVARISSVSENPVLKDVFSDIYAARIEIKEAIKGHPTDNSGNFQDLIISARYGVSEEALLELGKTYIIFLKSTDAGMHVLNGGQGAVSVDVGSTSSRLDISRLPKVRQIRSSVVADETCEGAQD
jgi:hypothetical protein